MMKQVKKLLAMGLALALALSLAACSSGDKPSETPSNSPSGTQSSQPSDPGKVDETGVEYNMLPFLKNYDEYRYDGHINVLYLVCTTLAEYFPNSYAVFEPKLADYDISIDLLGPPTYSDESLISTLESSLASGKYDLVLLYPITPSAITPLLDSMWEQYHVPIVGYAFDPTTECGHYYLGTSYYKGGTVLGQSIVDYVNKNSAYYDTLDTIPVAVYKNSAGGEQYARIRGALDVLMADGRFTLIEEYEANGEAVCLTQTETLLTTHPEVEVILTQIDNDVTGTYQTLISGLYPCSEYLSVWGYDATGAVCSLMAQDGEDGFVQGSAYISHEKVADCLVEVIPILVGAAKQGKLIEFTDEEFETMGYLFGDYYVTVTPENVNEHYTPNN